MVVAQSPMCFLAGPSDHRYVPLVIVCDLDIVEGYQSHDTGPHSNFLINTGSPHCSLIPPPANVHP